MAPVTRSKKKKDMETPANQTHSDSSRGVKRSAEEGEEEKNEETSMEKRGRPDEKETGILLEKAREEKNQHKEDETGKELIEAQQESSDNSHSETSFMYLPDDNHMNIFSFLDLPTRLKLRFNKRLDRIHFSVKAYLRSIKVEIRRSGSRLTMDDYTPVQYSNFIQLEEVLRQCAVNTFVSQITIIAYTDLNKRHCRVIDALFHFKSDCLTMDNSYVHTYGAPHLTLPYFLTLAQNVRFVTIRIDCTSVTAQDLCTIRKAMLEGECNKSFEMQFGREIKKYIMEEFFGVTIEEILGPLHGKIYRCTDETLEMYQGGSFINHFEADLQTTVGDRFISFKKLEVVEKPDAELKIKWNHVYADN